MTVTFPHLGNLFIPVKSLLDDIGVDYVIPSHGIRDALVRGAMHAPEAACLPLKITIGNIYDACMRGADAVLAVGGRGPCRFGYYCEMQKRILADMGCRPDFVLFDQPGENHGMFFTNLRKMTGGRRMSDIVHAVKNALSIMLLMDRFESLAYKKRPVESEKGRTDRIYGGFRDKAFSLRGTDAVIHSLKNSISELENIDTDGCDPAEVLKLGIVGEIYTTIETASSFNADAILGNMGVEVDRYVTLSCWVFGHILRNLVPGCGYDIDSRIKAARPYLGAAIGGHAVETIGNSVLYAQKGYDGILHIFPMTCMPEIAAKSILRRVQEDYGIPALSLVVDEMTGEAGCMTRLEAFVDLMRMRRKKKRAGVFSRY